MGGGDSFQEHLARVKSGQQRRKTAKTVSTERVLTVVKTDDNQL